LWTAAFGNSPTAGRLLSAFCSIAVVPIVCLLGRRFFNKEVGLTAGLLIAINPMHVWYGQEIRFYSTVEMLTAANVLCFSALTVRGGRWPWFAFVGTGIALLCSFYLSGVVLVAEAAFCILMWNKLNRRKILSAFVAIAAVFCFWFPVFIYQAVKRQGNLAWIEDVGAWLYVQMLYLRAVQGKGNMEFGWTGWATMPIFLGALFAGLIRCATVERLKRLPLLMWLLVPIVIVLGVSLFKPLYVTRYLLFVLPAFCLLVAAGVGAVKSRSLRFLLLLAIVCFMGQSLVHYYSEAKRDIRWSAAASLV
jgi:mannosyltransferase